jgi:peptidase E
MRIDLHLFSIPGEGDIGFILEACRPYLERQEKPCAALMQWASVSHDWLPYTRKAFGGLAEMISLSADPANLDENISAIDRCGAIYISGGNTYLLNDCLHKSGILAHLRSRAQDGLPVVGFSAGSILCGPNMLTTHDINMLPTRHFKSLNLLPYNIVAHYPSNDSERDEEDDWLSDYHARHANPILALEDDAYVRWDGKALQRVRGSAWILEPGSARARLDIVWKN